MIVATAGHIDHGKTTLVKALTGVDTDRLPEEKSRGISIDIGFAYLPIEGKGVKSLIGFVDVPGHEKFVRNMIAGVCGIDYALVVVAADDGVMPQTIEHVQILQLLGIRAGLIVVTKTDRVEPSRVAEVGAQVQALLEGTSLAGAAWLPASAVSGDGLPALREALVAAAQRTETRYQEGRHFRYAVDRAFTIKGSGTVVTGTVFDGQVANGDHLAVTPRGTEVRVRQIQIRGQAADSALAGQRCALNLVGVSVDEVGRGEWVLSPAMNRPSRRMEVRCTLLRDAPPLAHWTPVDVHMGTARVRARVATKGATDALKALAPGETRSLQLVLEREMTAVHGDRFILRDTSARHTLGGGVILDPFAPAGRRSAPSRLAYVAALEEGEPRAALEKLLAIPEQGTDLARFAATFNLHAGYVERLCKELKAVIVGRDKAPYAFAPATLAALHEKVMSALAEFHGSAPSAAQMEVAALRRAVAPQLTAPAFLAVLQGLAGQGKLEVLNSKLRLVHRGEAADTEDEGVWSRLMAALAKGGLTPPAIDKLALEIGVPEKTLKDLLFRRRGSGEVLRIPGERYYPKATMAMLAATAEMVAKANPEGTFSAAQFRDATGIPRDIVIPILEFLDSLAITRRIGDVRKLVKDRIPILGDSPPAPKPAVLPKATPPNPVKKKVVRRW